MLEIHRRIGNPNWATKLRSRWEKMKAQVVETVEEGELLAKNGHLVVIDHTNGGKDLEESNWRDNKPVYETRYIEPELDHSCDHTKNWFELRFKTADNASNVDMGYEDGPYWARMVKEGFLSNIRKEFEKNHSNQECGCDKDAKMKAIKRIVGLGPIKQGSIESRIQIDSRYADLENLLDLNPDTPEEPTVFSLWDT